MPNEQNMPDEQNSQPRKVSGVILAGGRGSRMDYQDKALLPLQGKPLIEHVINGAEGQVDGLMISVNRNPDKYESLDLPLIPDFSNEYAGPLVGICSAMRILHQQQLDHYLACFPADVPLFPDDIVASLLASLKKHNCQAVFARHKQQLQPLFSIWHLNALPVLEQGIRDGLFGPKLIMGKLDHVIVDVDDTDASHFLNINDAETLSFVQNLCSSQ